MKKKNSNPVGALKRTGVYMKSSLGVIALALVLAALSAVMTIIGPDKIGKMATIMSDGLFTGIDLAAIPCHYLLPERAVWLYPALYHGGRDAENVLPHER